MWDFEFLFSDLTSTKERAITAILDRLIGAGALASEQRQLVLAAILQREQLGSTAIGCGVAVPHCKIPNVDHPISALATFPAGVDFDSLDGEPVRRVFLLVSPQDRPGDHMRLLEAVSRRLRAEA